MHSRTRALSAIGFAAGVLLMATTAVAPAYAAKPAPPAPPSSLSCSSLQGTAVVGSSHAVTGVSLQSGDAITAAVAPGRAGDSIFLSSSVGLNLIFADGPTSGFTWVAPITGVYNLRWSYQTAADVPTDLAWSFSATCSPAPTESPKPGKGKGNGKG